MHPITHRLLRLTQGLTGGREIFLGFANPDWRESQSRVLKRPGRETVGSKETVKFRGQFGHAAFASVVLRKAGYQDVLSTIAVPTWSFASPRSLDS